MTDVENVLRAYVACALWSSHDWATEDGGEPLDANYGPEDIAPEALTSMREDVCAFLADSDLVDALAFWRAELGAEQIGHDFWLTRNGHGAGFWDRFMAEPGAAFGAELTDASGSCGECDLYVGDDDCIYLGS